MFSKLKAQIYRAPAGNSVRWSYLAVSLIFLLLAGIETTRFGGSGVGAVQLALSMVFSLVGVAESLPVTQQHIAGHLRLAGVVLGLLSLAVALRNLVALLA